MKNKKILSALLIATIWATWLSYSFADDISSTSDSSVKTYKERPELTDEQKAQMEEIRTIMEKQKNGETLTSEEESTLDEFKSNMPEIKGDRWDKDNFKWWVERWFMWDSLTDEEKTALESMTTEEKQAFYEAKRVEQESERQAQENVIDKLLAWEILTSEEEVVRQEIITQRAEKKVEMEERQAKMEEMKTIMEKQNSWEELTEDEQTILDEFKSWEWRWKFHR